MLADLAVRGIRKFMKKSCNFSFFILRIWLRQFGPPPGLPLVARSSRPTLAVLVIRKFMKKVAIFRFSFFVYGYANYGLLWDAPGSTPAVHSELTLSKEAHR